jgi:hypothetical protein
VEFRWLTHLAAVLRDARIREYALLNAGVLITRSLLHLAGVRFNFVLDWMLLADPEYLRTDLLKTLYYSHAYPPGFNLLAGLVLKLGGSHAPAVAHFVFQLVGLVLVSSLFYLCRACGLSSRAALAIAGAFSIAPQSVYFEHLHHHTYPTAALLALVAVLFHAAVRARSFWKWFGFFAACAALGWMRATFHLVWFGTMMCLALLFSEKAERSRVLAAAAAPGASLVAVYLKNLFLVGVFGATTFGPANLTTVTVRRLPREVREAWIAEGKLSPFAHIDVYAGVREYAPFFATAENDSWPPMMNELDRPTVGAPNYDHWWFLEVNPKRRDDAIYCLKARPLAYAGDVLENAKRFFGPSTEWHPKDESDRSPHYQHRQVLGGWEHFYNGIVHGVPVAPVGLYVFVPLACVWAVRRARSLIRSGDRQSVPVGALLYFTVLQIGFVTLTSTLFTFGEMSRYRYEVESFICLLMALAAAAFVPHARRVVARRGLR